MTFLRNVMNKLFSIGNDVFKNFILRFDKTFSTISHGHGKRRFVTTGDWVLRGGLYH